MKVFVFVRGIDSPLKRTTVSMMMKALNPNPNTVRGIRVSMDEFGPLTDKASRKAADRSCKNRVKKLIGGSHNEQFIVIDNETLNPEHWQSYFSMIEGINQNAIGVGIEVISPVNMISDEDIPKINLQDVKVHLFKAYMYKYVEIKSDGDIEDAIELLNSLSKNNSGE